jgi:tRNA dimethylallyltransferase
MLAGPTASGKTDISFCLCEKYPFEIISVDSALIYRRMDIGTAKPTLAERSKYIHHLIDIVEPHQTYSAAQFVSDCNRLIHEIKLRGKIPLLVGGTMMYFKALIDGLSDLPDRDEAIRSSLEKEAQLKGWGYLHNRLSEKDPDIASKIKPNDSQRIQRMLEVIEITGKRYTDVIKSHKPGINFDIEFISIEPSNRTTLHDRISQRFNIMLAKGFLEEFENLYHDKTLTNVMPSMRCVGYRQAWQYMSGEYDYNTFVDKSIVATRQLAKRQLTWLRNWTSCQVNRFDSLSNNLEASVLSYIHNKFQK